MSSMENFHEPSGRRLGCSGGSDTPTAWLKTGAKTLEQLAISSARRVPPPLRFGAALVYVLIHHKPAGRDPAGAGRSRVFALPIRGHIGPFSLSRRQWAASGSRHLVRHSFGNKGRRRKDFGELSRVARRRRKRGRLHGSALRRHRKVSLSSTNLSVYEELRCDSLRPIQ
jgi:hypothetical protein